MVLEANKEQCTFRESAESQRKTIKQAVNSFCHNNEMLNGRTMILLLRHSAIIFYCVIQCVWQFNQALSGFVVGHHGNISYEVKQFYLHIVLLFVFDCDCLFVCFLPLCWKVAILKLVIVLYRWWLLYYIYLYTVNLKRSLIILEHHTGQDWRVQNLYLDKRTFFPTLRC